MAEWQAAPDLIERSEVCDLGCEDYVSELAEVVSREGRGDGGKGIRVGSGARDVEWSRGQVEQLGLGMKLTIGEEESFVVGWCSWDVDVGLVFAEVLQCWETVLAGRSIRHGEDWHSEELVVDLIPELWRQGE